MLRMVMLSLIVVSVSAQWSLAQKPQEPMKSPNKDPFPSFDESFPADAEDAAIEEPAEDKKSSPEWQPSMRVFINETPGSQTSVRKVQQISERPLTVYEAARVDGKNVMKHRTTVQRVSEEKFVVASGGTIIDCDDIDLQVHAAEKNGKSFEFTIDGRTRIRTESTEINAASAKLQKGKLTLTDVQLSTDGVSMTSSEVVLDLPILTLRIGESIDVIAPTPAPAPHSDRGFQPFYNEPTPAAFQPAPKRNTIPSN